MVGRLMGQLLPGAAFEALGVDEAGFGLGGGAGGVDDGLGGIAEGVCEEAAIDAFGGCVSAVEAGGEDGDVAKEGLDALAGPGAGDEGLKGLGVAHETELAGEGVGGLGGVGLATADGLEWRGIDLEFRGGGEEVGVAHEAEEAEDLSDGLVAADHVVCGLALEVGEALDGALAELFVARAPG